MTGVNADRFVSLTDKSQRHKAVLPCVEQFHPGIRNDVVDDEDCAWMEQQLPGGGAWTLFEPGGHERYQEPSRQAASARKPEGVFRRRTPLPPDGWMQSAISTSIEATLKVLAAP